MMLSGIDTQAHVVDVCLHLSPAGNQFLHKGYAHRDIEEHHSSAPEGMEGHLRHRRA